MFVFLSYIGLSLSFSLVIYKLRDFGYFYLNFLCVCYFKKKGREWVSKWYLLFCLGIIYDISKNWDIEIFGIG